MLLREKKTDLVSNNPNKGWHAVKPTNQLNLLEISSGSVILFLTWKEITANEILNVYSNKFI